MPNAASHSERKLIQLQTITELKERKSTRVFTEEAISDEVKDMLYEAAFQAPTAGNQMLYSIIEISDEKQKRLLAETCDHQLFITKAKLVVVFVADHRRWLDLYASAGCDAREPGVGDMWLALSDANIAAQNMVVAAHALGLGSCYIGDIIEQHERVKEALRLPDEVMPACMLVFGYPTEQQQERRKPARFHKDYIVHQNTYQTLTPQEHRHFFAERAQRNGTPLVDYEAQVKAFWKRKYESEFSQEMNRSAKAYLKPLIKE